MPSSARPKPASKKPPQPLSTTTPTETASFPKPSPYFTMKVCYPFEPLHYIGQRYARVTHHKNARSPSLSISFRRNGWWYERSVIKITRRGRKIGINISRQNVPISPKRRKKERRYILYRRRSKSTKKEQLSPNPWLSNPYKGRSISTSTRSWNAAKNYWTIIAARPNNWLWIGIDSARNTEKPCLD